MVQNIMHTVQTEWPLARGLASSLQNKPGSKPKIHDIRRNRTQGSRGKHQKWIIFFWGVVGVVCVSFFFFLSFFLGEYNSIKL